MENRDKNIEGLSSIIKLKAFRKLTDILLKEKIIDF